MNDDEADDRLNSLFAKARTLDQGPSLREEGFEGRLMARLREQRCQGTPWYLWAWRSVPLFTAVIVVLISVCGSQTAVTGDYLSQALTGGYEEATLVSYYTGE
jgi:hypothetical protein